MFYNAQSEINQVPNSELQINNFFYSRFSAKSPLKKCQTSQTCWLAEKKKKKREKIRAIKINNSHTFPKKKSPKGRINTHFNAL